MLTLPFNKQAKIDLLCKQEELYHNEGGTSCDLGEENSS